MTTESAFDRKSHYYEAHQTDKLTFDLCTDFIMLLQHFSKRVKCLNTKKKKSHLMLVGYSLLLYVYFALVQKN